VKPALDHSVGVAGTWLRVQVLGDTGACPLVMLHGMHDVGETLAPIAEELAKRFRVFVPDLRGHGESDRSPVYSLPGFVYDLIRTLDHFDLEAPFLFGHSLGGQILTRFCAMYPSRVRALVAVEGLGPPDSRAMVGRDGDPGSDIRAEGRHLLATFSAKDRTLPSLEFAAQRLCANNPRLDFQHADKLAAVMTHQDADGNLRWAFDPRVRMTFNGEEDAPRYWPHVMCPTHLVCGDFAHEYWAGAVASTTHWDGRFAPGELEGKAARFACADMVHFDGSGHMVHHDEPNRLAATTRAFFEQHLPAKNSGSDPA
jgi:pimeloyl-ACP methyl ester carboxylesterase